jgi:hypothetical protein
MDAKVIDHQQAITNLMAERYLLGELSEDERDAYEAHLFDCQVCFEQVKAGTEFVGYIKRVGAEKPVSAVVESQWGWLVNRALRPAPILALAACVLAAFSVGQNMITIRMLKAPQVESRSIVLSDVPRSGAGQESISRNNRIILAIDFQPRKEFVSYAAQIVSEDGKTKFTIPFSPHASQTSLEVSLYAGDLHSGNYSMFVRATDQDGAGHELAHGNFKVQLRD